MSRAISSEEVGRFLQACVDRGIAIRPPTVDELVELWPAECLLRIARHRGFALRLVDGRIACDGKLPSWFADAIFIFRAELIELMGADFLGSWR